jgi:hypothetical protein
MSTTLQGHIKNGVVVFDGPMALPDGTAVRVEAETVEQRFQRLKAEWDAATAHHSNPSIIMGHAAMRAIVAMGMEVVPVILRDLQAGGCWQMTWALTEITGENIAPPKIEGGFAKWNAGEQRNAWLQWGREKKLV